LLVADTPPRNCTIATLDYDPIMLNTCFYRVWRPVVTFGAAACFSVIALVADAQDVVEFLNGTKVEGKVTAIRKADKEFDFSASIGNRETSRTFAFASVHAVTLNGTRHVLTPPSADSRMPADTPPADSNETAAVRSPAEINRMIDHAGQKPPDWFELTQLEYPPTLDLSWPLNAPDGGWNNQVNMGQYIWDIINPNPHRWRSGIKLVHHCMTLHANQPALLKRDMQTLGMMYFQLLQDYSRAAFWLRKAGNAASGREQVALAECYWRLGSRSMALAVLRDRSLPISAIKLLGDLGETDRAVQLATAAGKTPQGPEGFLLAGDALRQVGQYQKAVEFYQFVLKSDQYRNQEYETIHKARARESIDAIRLFDQLDVATLSDGTYTGTSTGYNGPIDVAVDVRGGRLDAVKVTHHQEKQFYSALDDTPRRILDKQSVQEVDAVTGATITSQAIVNAAARALAAGR
jgi:uncharacterized protein with FMN-binding domain